MSDLFRTEEGVTKVRCIICDGRGRFYVGERDPIEGSKMQQTTPCHFCRGNKYILAESAPGAACIAYNEYLKKLATEQEAEEERKRNQRRMILEKLTDSDLTILGHTREDLIR